VSASRQSARATGKGAHATGKGAHASPTAQRIPAPRLERFARDVLVQAGIPPEYAAQSARHLVLCDLRGVETHGITRLSALVQRIRNGVVNAAANIHVERQRPAAALVNGDNGLGVPVSTYATQLAIRLAREQGIGTVGVHNSNHFGMAADYALQMADAACLGIVTTNSSPAMVPWGAAKKFLGTNPICFGAPAHGSPLILDMATSVVAMGHVVLAEKRGQSIPDTWAVGPDGLPTTDPTRARQGGARPLADYKGSGLALMVEIFTSLLTGATLGVHAAGFFSDMSRPADVAHLFIAIDIEAFAGLESFKERLQALLTEMRELPLAPGFDRVTLPGEIEQECMAERLANGVPLDPAVLADLRQVSAQTGVALSV
jgi:ureidoglycolate dehydrogenase (NAD+)